MKTEQNQLELAMQCIAHPLSRGISDIEQTGEAMLDLLRENGQLRAFIRRLTHPEDLGHAVTPEVRQLAAKVLRGEVSPPAAPTTQEPTHVTKPL